MNGTSCLTSAPVCDLAKARGRQMAGLRALLAIGFEKRSFAEQEVGLVGQRVKAVRLASVSARFSRID